MKNNKHLPKTNQTKPASCLLYYALDLEAIWSGWEERKCLKENKEALQIDSNTFSMFRTVHKNKI